MGIVVEGAMKRDWRIRRALLATPEGQRRWDRAYQQLLSWAGPATAGAIPAASAPGIGEREAGVGDGHSDLRPGLNAAAGAGADD